MSPEDLLMDGCWAMMITRISFDTAILKTSPSPIPSLQSVYGITINLAQITSSPKIDLSGSSLSPSGCSVLVGAIFQDLFRVSQAASLTQRLMIGGSRSRSWLRLLACAISHRPCHERLRNIEQARSVRWDAREAASLLKT